MPLERTASEQLAREGAPEELTRALRGTALDDWMILREATVDVDGSLILDFLQDLDLPPNGIMELSHQQDRAVRLG